MIAIRSRTRAAAAVLCIATLTLLVPLGIRVRDLQRYVTEGGAIFRDDTGDPLMTLDMYEDGDHIRREARRRYTEILHARLSHLFQ